MQFSAALCISGVLYEKDIKWSGFSMGRTKQFAWIVLPCCHTPLMSNVLNRLFCLHVIEMLKSGELSIPAVQPCTPHVYTVLLADNSLIFAHVATLICINIPSLCCCKHKIGQVCVYLF